jgi:hypothetical protein
MRYIVIKIKVLFEQNGTIRHNCSTLRSASTRCLTDTVFRKENSIQQMNEIVMYGFQTMIMDALFQYSNVHHCRYVINVSCVHGIMMMPTETSRLNSICRLPVNKVKDQLLKQITFIVNNKSKWKRTLFFL